MKRLTIELKGPKGAGKTTVARLIKHVLGLYNVDIVEVDDKDLNKGKHRYDLNKCMESLSERVQVKIETKSDTVPQVVTYKYDPKKTTPRKQWSDKEI